MRSIAAGCAFVVASALVVARAEGPSIDRSVAAARDRSALKRDVHRLVGAAGRGLWERARFVARRRADRRTLWSVLRTGYTGVAERGRVAGARERLDGLVDRLAGADAAAVRATLRHQRQQSRPRWLRDRAAGLSGYRGPRRASGRTEIRALIDAAAEADALVRIDYTRGADGGRGEYLIAPRWFAVSQQDQEYLQAVKLDGGREHRRFRLDRIHEAWLTGEPAPAADHPPTKEEVAFWREVKRISGELAGPVR